MQTSEVLDVPIHGGQINSAALKFNIPREKWVDLSTGINPNGWPVPTLPSSVFQRLPEENDELNSTAQQYYKAENVLAIAGSQAAIQLLPLIRSRSRVGIVNPGYKEHAHCWQSAGHEVQLLAAENIEAALDTIDVLIIINPNNPTGMLYSKEQLLKWQSTLAKRGGWLVVDEAFIDVEFDNSLVTFTQRKGLIVLRSLGKFFGLAGLRIGFVFSESSLLIELARRLGPWSISHPSRYIATQALLDTEWQAQTRVELKNKSERLVELMRKYGLTPSGGTNFFQWIRHKNANQLFDQLAHQAILVRLFEDSSSLRFGLPENEVAWERLNNALQTMRIKTNSVSLS